MFSNAGEFSQVIYCLEIVLATGFPWTKPFENMHLMGDKYCLQSVISTYIGLKWILEFFLPWHPR